MADSVLHPFHVPTFATNQYDASMSMVMEDHPTAYNQILNQCTSIRCTRAFLRGKRTPDLALSNVGFICFDCLDYYYVNFKYVYPYCKEIIKNILDDGFYIFYYYADDYYIPGKSGYGTRHIHHDGIILGYDENDDTYSIAGYNINWVFSLMRVPREDFMRAVKSSLDNKKYGNITYYKVRENVNVELDPEMILKNLKKYIDADIDKFSLESDDQVDGIAVHDFMAMYIDRIRKGQLSPYQMDSRSMRPIWEHKKCMLDRIIALENKNEWGSELSSEYKSIVDTADKLRLMYAVYDRTQRPSLLDSIYNGLFEIKAKEKDILTRLILKMENSNISHC